MRRRWASLLVFTLMVVISYGTFQNPFSQDFFSTIKETSVPVAKPSEDELWKEIEEKAKNYEEAAQNATIDKVWKKMPGLNGVKVDVEKSYENMKEKGSFNPSLLSLKQTEPEVSIADLPAAPIYRGHPDKAMVALNINVSWGEEYIPKMLNILKDQDVKATFFIEGKWANMHSDLVKMIQEQGHAIGNHAYNHPDMSRLTADEIQKQLVKTNDILKAITGEKPTLFAPPSGSFSNEVVKIADEQNMETILWSVDTIDWKKPSKDVLLQRVVPKLHNGAFILMHPTQSSNSALNDLILKIKEKKYKIGTVNNVLNEKRLLTK
ncbi:polysaccharide deacetylase family protein [Pontibacillus yanchengensis]|uniref:NodB homology domain-containing protein n=1 Tax=Pontibacillus yanchengensis Y32 TaxID=1385514 RepID=A0A0A2TXN8_9BACI|nr:polysaccharide deacetylase family protein [Pontibacillus yanchengensis]KGP74035.1 hypothetical protein N782_19235 [Pontibacillus yanchengensis Y32]